MKKVLVTAVLAASTALPSPISTANAQTISSISSTTNYHTVTVDGLKIFYREAGPKDAPTILLLHGYPSSSRMFATLIPLLADRYHLVAPDYPGFGESDVPPAAQFHYTFDHLAEVMGHFTNQLGLHSYALYQQDYGGPIGMRLVRPYVRLAPRAQTFRRRKNIVDRILIAERPVREIARAVPDVARKAEERIMVACAAPCCPRPMFGGSVPVTR